MSVGASLVIDFSMSWPSTGNSNYPTNILLSVGASLVIDFSLHW